MRFLGHNLEKNSRQQRLSRYRSVPSFSHLADPDQLRQEAEKEGKKGEELRKAVEIKHVTAEYSEDSGYAEVRIVGPIDPWYYFSARRIIEWLDGLEGLKRIHLVITSPGGYVDEAQALYSDLRRKAKQGIKITSEGLGMVASAATDLLLAGDERSASDETIVMQHPIDVFSWLDGSKVEVEQQFSELMSMVNAYEAQNFGIMRERTGQDDETLRQWLIEPGEEWFSVSQAYDAGILNVKPDSYVEEDEEDGETQIRQQGNRLIEAFNQEAKQES